MKYLLMLIFFVLTGCASMFNGGVQAVHVDAESRLAVTVASPSANYEVSTPTTIVTLPSSYKEVEITVTEPGYLKTTRTVNRTVSPTYWLNFFNLYGFVIDYLSGYMWNYEASVLVPAIKERRRGSDAE